MNSSSGVLRYASIGGALAALLNVASLFLPAQLPLVLLQIIPILFTVSLAFFYYGFVIIGRKCGNNPLRVFSYFFIVLNVLLLLVFSLGLYAQAINLDFWVTILNRDLGSIIGIGFALVLIPLFSRFGYLIAAYTTVLILSNAIFPFFGSSTIGSLLEFISYFLGVLLLLRAARD